MQAHSFNFASRLLVQFGACPFIIFSATHFEFFHLRKQKGHLLWFLEFELSGELALEMGCTCPSLGKGLFLSLHPRFLQGRLGLNRIVLLTL